MAACWLPGSGRSQVKWVPVRGPVLAGPLGDGDGLLDLSSKGRTLTLVISLNFCAQGTERAQIRCESPVGGLHESVPPTVTGSQHPGPLPPSLKQRQLRTQHLGVAGSTPCWRLVLNPGEGTRTSSSWCVSVESKTRMNGGLSHEQTLPRAAWTASRALPVEGGQGSLTLACSLQNNSRAPAAASTGWSFKQIYASIPKGQ